MSKKRTVKYNGQSMPVPDEMSIEQLKQHMARFFPELAEPEVKTETKDEETIYTFSKKAGRKGNGQTPPSFSAYCIVELFGHTTLAGLVTEQTIGGQAFIRLDVPELDGQPAYTRFLGQGSIYSMTPVTEEIALNALRRIRPVPINVFYLSAPKPTDADPFGPSEFDDED